MDETEVVTFRAAGGLTAAVAPVCSMICLLMCVVIGSLALLAMRNGEGFPGPMLFLTGVAVMGTWIGAGTYDLLRAYRRPVLVARRDEDLVVYAPALLADPLVVPVEHLTVLAHFRPSRLLGTHERVDVPSLVALDDLTRRS